MQAVTASLVAACLEGQAVCRGPFRARLPLCFHSTLSSTSPAELSIAPVVCPLPSLLWLQSLAICTAGQLHQGQLAARGEPLSPATELPWADGDRWACLGCWGHSWSQPGEDVHLAGLSQREWWKTSGVFALAHCWRCKKTSDMGNSLQLPKSLIPFYSG